MKKKSAKKIQKGKVVYSGKIFTITQKPVSFPDGSKTIFEYCERPASVSTLAFNEKNELLMIKEYRQGFKKNVWFLPGGRMDQPNDTPRSAAQRELREETGFRAKKMKRVSKNSPSNTLIWDIYLYTAKDLVYDPLPQDEFEHITVHFVPIDQAVQMALDGTIENEFISYYIIRFNYMLSHGQFSW